jgi:acyl-CoA hydrolase
MALPSWHPKAQVSSIVPRLSENVTSFQHSFVVTEQGAAACFGHTQSEQALNLINKAAHPDAKDGLIQAASELGLLK